MTRTTTFSQRFLVALAALLALAVYRVDSAAAPTPPYGGYTWQTALDEVRHEVGATVTGLRAHVLEARATFEQMRQDVRELEARIGSTGAR